MYGFFEGICREKQEWWDVQSFCTVRRHVNGNQLNGRFEHVYLNLKTIIPEFARRSVIYIYRYRWYIYIYTLCTDPLTSIHFHQEVCQPILWVTSHPSKRVKRLHFNPTQPNPSCIGSKKGQRTSWNRPCPSTLWARSHGGFVGRGFGWHHPWREAWLGWKGTGLSGKTLMWDSCMVCFFVEFCGDRLSLGVW